MSGVVTRGTEQPPKISDARTLSLVAQLLLKGGSVALEWEATEPAPSANQSLTDFTRPRSGASVEDTGDG